jgi:hypothetical protein
MITDQRASAPLFATASEDRRKRRLTDHPQVQQSHSIACAPDELIKLVNMIPDEMAAHDMKRWALPLGPPAFERARLFSKISRRLGRIEPWADKARR